MSFTFTKNPTELLDFIRESNELSLDTETTGLEYNARIVLLQVGKPDGSVCILDCRHLDKLEKYQIGASIQFGRDLQRALHGRRILIHNSVYDLKILLCNFGCEVIPAWDYKTRIVDTMLQERVLRNDANGYGAGLGELTWRYLSVKLNKDYNNAIARSFANTRGDFTDNQLKYAAQDVQYLFHIDRLQRQFARNLEVGHIFDLENEVTSVLARMEVRGFHLDMEKWKTIVDDARAKKFDALYGLENFLIDYLGSAQPSLFDGSVDPRIVKLVGSNDKISAYYTKLLGKKPESCNKKFLQMMEDNDDVFAGMLLEYRNYYKFLTDFGDKLPTLLDSDGYLHPTFDSIKRSGRLGCSNPNLMNIPARGDDGAKIRACFTAPRGYKMITADYSQMELRVLAALSCDPTFLAEFMDPNGDPHRAMAVRAYHVTPEQVTKLQRTMAKTTNFSVVYGIGWRSLRSQLMSMTRQMVTEQETKMMIAGFKSTFPVAVDYLDTLQRSTIIQGYTRTPFGRIRWLEEPDRNNEDYDYIMMSLMRKGANTPIQGANADATKRAMVAAYRKLDRLGAWLCNTVHDELCAYAPEDNADEAKDILESCMVAGVDFIKTDIPFIVDAHVAEYWSKE